MNALLWHIFVPSIGIFPELILSCQVKIREFIVQSKKNGTLSFLGSNRAHSMELL